MMQIFQTGTKSEGIAFGTAFVIKEDEAGSGTSSIRGDEAIALFGEAMKKVGKDLAEEAKRNDVFAAHREMLEDPMLYEDVTDNLKNGDNLETAIRLAENKIAALFENIDDEYIKQRVDDVRDVFGRLLSFVSGKDKTNPYERIPEGSVIVAHNLAPSDTAKMDVGKISAFVTESGGKTTHVGIFARNNGIVALANVKGCAEEIKAGSFLIVDGEGGRVIANPDEATLSEYENLAESCTDKIAAAEPDLPLVFRDKAIRVFGNAGNLNEVRKAISEGADGIGLFRSEFLFMQSKEMPDEQTQFEAYREALEICKGKPLTIRTLDVGGDKDLPYLGLEKEDNPYLGVRGIRLSLSHKDLFKMQLRAILRAGVFGNVRIMFPMVAIPGEVIAAKEILDECKSELDNEHLDYGKDIEIGAMVETPAAVLCAEELGKVVDFFSIGTNDLTQYIMAADRGNPALADLCDTAQDAVQKALALTIEAAHKDGIAAGICGEYAATDSSTERLLQMGMDYFSVAPPSVRKIKRNIRNCH